MRYKTVFLVLLALAALVMPASRTNAQTFLATDWIQHRGNRSAVPPAALTELSKGREGRNAGDLPENVQPVVKGRVWIWPPPADMPAEMASDDTWPTVPPMFPAGGSWNLGPT